MTRRIYAKKMGEVFRDEDNEPRWDKFFTAEQAAIIAGYSVPKDKKEKARFLKRVRKAISRYRQENQEIMELYEPRGEVGRLPTFVYTNIGGVYRYGYTTNALLAHRCAYINLKWQAGYLKYWDHWFEMAKANLKDYDIDGQLETSLEEKRQAMAIEAINLLNIEKFLAKSEGQKNLF